MRIAYLVHLNMAPETGVFKKVMQQSRQWRRLGHTCRVFAVTRAQEVAQGLREEVLNGDAEVFVYPGGYSLSSLGERLRTLGRAVDAILDWHPDLVYTRQDLYYPPLRRLAASLPLVVEVNTRAGTELWIESKLKWLYHQVTEGRALRSAAGFVLVTNELAGMRTFSRHRKRQAVIANGINLSDIPVRESTHLPGLRLVFMGERGYSWHGVDKMITIAAAFPEWRLDVVGWRRSDLVRDSPPNIAFHGPLHSAEYRSILEAADCAIGTLALHRKGMEEACPLKTREYLAYGLPVVIGYRDTDFPEGANFLLQLPNREDGVRKNLPAIREFVLGWIGKRVPRDAIAHIDGTKKESARLGFFSSLLQPPAEGDDKEWQDRL